MSNSPFDFAKSITTTKEDLYSTEEIFKKEYLPFMVNRILSNHPQSVLFADAMNQYPELDSKLQYDFYRLGLPKIKSSKMWTKKEVDEPSVELASIVAKHLNVNITRAMEYMAIIGSNAVQELNEKQGGRK